MMHARQKTLFHPGQYNNNHPLWHHIVETARPVQKYNAKNINLLVVGDGSNIVSR